MISFNTVKEKFISVAVIAELDWTLPFVQMCNYSDYVVRATYYASETLTNTQLNYGTTEKELFDVQFDFNKVKAYLINSNIVLLNLSSSTSGQIEGSNSELKKILELMHY